MPDNAYMENAQGHLVPLEHVRPIDMARHELVMEKVAKVKAMRTALAALKAEIMADVEAFIDLSAEKYKVKLGGTKGNVALPSYDGKFKLVRQMAEDISFGEQLQAAKSLIDECLRDWTQGARSELRALVDSAFQVDKAGNLSTARVLGLRRLEITDDRWTRAMAAIDDSIQVTGTRPYVRVYERDAQGRYNAIPLDMAAV